MAGNGNDSSGRQLRLAGAALVWLIVGIIALPVLGCGLCFVSGLVR